MKDYNNKPCYPELIAIIAVGALYVVMKLAHLRIATEIYSAIVIGGFIIYLVWRMARTKGVFRLWGMRTDNFWPALRAQLLFGIPAAALIYKFGLQAGSAPIRKTFWIVLALYPLWGIVQQFALQNFIGKNLRTLLRQPLLYALVVALFFSVSHFPCLPLMALALAGGFFFTLIYRRIPNLWAVGIVHSLLGVMVYYFVLNENPGTEILGFFR